MKKKIYAVMLVVAMLAMTLVGCGSDTTDTTNTTNDVTVNTEVEESGEDVVVEPTTEPIVEPTTEPEVEEPVVEPTEEPTTEDGEDEFYSDSYQWAFPESIGVEGFTDKFVYANDETMSFNCTHYIAKDGTEMNFSWVGPTELGEKADAGNTTLFLYGNDSAYELRAWNGGELKLEELEECLALEKDVWTSLSGSDVSYPENGYYNIERVDNIVYVTYAVKTDTMNGYSYFICNGDAGNYYMFTYLENNEIYNDERALSVVNSLEYWTYNSGEIVTE